MLSSNDITRNTTFLASVVLANVPKAQTDYTIQPSFQVLYKDAP